MKAFTIIAVHSRQPNSRSTSYQHLLVPNVYFTLLENSRFMKRQPLVPVSSVATSTHLLGHLAALPLEKKCQKCTRTNHANCLGQTCAKLYTLFRTDLCEIIYPVQDREDENHTLSSSTSPYRPYNWQYPPGFVWTQKSSSF